MVLVAANVSKDVVKQLQEICLVFYEKEKISSCLREIIHDVIRAYIRVKPSKEAFQRTLLEILRSRSRY